VLLPLIAQFEFFWNLNNFGEAKLFSWTLGTSLTSMEAQRNFIASKL